MDLTAGPGQLIAVAGENGAGKSILPKILAADSGTVRLAWPLGYCPQDPVLSEQPYRRPEPALLRRRLAAPVAAPPRRAGRLARLRRPAAPGPWRAVGRGPGRSWTLTLALMHDPDLLLLDEPYQGFDLETYLQFWDLLTACAPAATPSSR